MSKLSDDTTVKILEYNKILLHAGTNYYSGNKLNGGVSIIYPMIVPTNIFNLAGIIPTSADNSVIARAEACIFALDDNKIPFSFVNETTQANGYNRWAQDINSQMTEFSQSWTLDATFYFVQFTVDLRYIDDAYMYDKNTGNIFFAGKNTQYYRKVNISDI